MSDGLGDFFGGGNTGAPAISWDEARVGESWTGIIVPSDVNEPDVAYQTTQATSVQQELLYWAPKGSGKAQTTDAVSGGQNNPPVRQAVITVLTTFSGFEFMSTQSKERAETDERKDDGLRRTFIKGGSLTKGFVDALKAAKTRKPEVAATMTVKLVKRTPNDYGGKTNEFEVTYAAPTDDTRAKVKAYIASKADAEVFGGADDAEPPF